MNDLVWVLHVQVIVASVRGNLFNPTRLVNNVRDIIIREFDTQPASRIQQRMLVQLRNLDTGHSFKIFEWRQDTVGQFLKLVSFGPVFE